MTPTMPRLSRRGALLACMLLAAGTAAAQTAASRPLSLIVPYPVGGLSDAVARVVERPLGKALGQMVLVENIGGVGGAIAAQKVLVAPADGGMIYQGSPNELILTPMALQAVKYKSEDFRLVQIIGAMPMAVVVRKDLPAGAKVPRILMRPWSASATCCAPTVMKDTSSTPPARSCPSGAPPL